MMEDTVKDTHHPTPDHSRVGRIDWVHHCNLRRRALLWGILAGVGLLLVYGLTLALANSLGHALTEFVKLWYWMVPLVVGFALQVGLYAYAHRATHQGKRAGSSGVVASGGASVLSMVACCAHHLADVLPLMGLAGLSVFLSDYQSIFLLTGLLSNIVGLTYVMGLLSEHGLFPQRRSLMSVALVLPVKKAFKFVFVAAVLVMVAAIVVEVIS